MHTIRTLLAFVAVTSFSVVASVEVPDDVRDSIITQVIQEQGYFDAALIEKRVREWQLAQPQPNASGKLLAEGDCQNGCEQAGGNLDLPMPRNVKFKGKIKDGKLTQHFIIKWKRPVKLPDDSPHQLSHYVVHVSKSGDAYEQYRVDAKFKNNGRPKKKQKLKLRNIPEGEYSAQVRAVYTNSQTANSHKNMSLKGGAGIESGWTETQGGSSKGETYTVGDLAAGSALRACLLDNDANTPNEVVTASTLVSDITDIKCIDKGLLDFDVQQLSLFGGLTKLNIAKNGAITNLTPLKELVHLSWLKVNFLQSADLTVLADADAFDSLESLFIGRLDLTQIPVFPDTVTYLELAGNKISDNAGGFWPDHPLNSINVSNNKASFGASPAEDGPLILGDGFLTGLANNHVELKTLVLKHTIITDLANLVGISGLENLDFWNGNLNDTQNLENLSGFCSLKIQSNQLKKIKTKRPVQFLDLSDNTQLKLTHFFNEVDGHEYQPLSANLSGSNTQQCTGYYKAEDITEPHLSNFGIVQPFTLQNGNQAVIPGCPSSKLAPQFTNSEFCKPNAPNNVFVYKDTNSTRTYVEWEKNSSHDYARWGVTHYKVAFYDGDQLLRTRYTSGLESLLIEDSQLVNKLEVSACTENQCGYVQTKTAPFETGLSRVSQLSQNWQGDSVQFSFAYDQSVFNQDKGAPEYFEVSTAFSQPNGSSLLFNVPVSGYQTEWVTTAFDPNDYIGQQYLVRACRSDIGCSKDVTILLSQPQGQTQIDVATNFSALPGSSNTEIILSWEQGNNWDLVDYIEITETQPEMASGERINDVVLNENESTAVFYTDEIDQPINLTRVTNGTYTFKLRACKRDRENGDLCSNEVVSQKNILRTGISFVPGALSPGLDDNGKEQVVYTRSVSHDAWKWPSDVPNDDTSTDRAITYHIEFRYDNQPNVKRPDYFFVELLDGSASCYEQVVEKSTDPNTTPLIQYRGVTEFVLEDIGGVNATDISTASVCNFPKRRGTWGISACHNGIGCGEVMTVNMSNGDVGFLDVSNTEIHETEYVDSPAYIENVPVGNEPLSSGHYWNPSQAGTGWQFYWATHLDGKKYCEQNSGANDCSNIDHGVTYDLIAYWFGYKKTYAAEQGDTDYGVYEWTPVWYKAKLIESGEGFYQGSLVDYSHSNGSSSTSFGTLSINLEAQSTGTFDVRVAIDVNSAHIETRLDNSLENQICQVAVDGGNNKCTFDLYDYSFTTVDQGAAQNTHASHFGLGNDEDHYSGVWEHGSNLSGLPVPQVTFITTIHRSFEAAWVATFDDAGDAIWAVAHSCDDQECHGLPGKAYYESGIKVNDFNLYTIPYGFNPLYKTPEGFWNESPVQGLGQGGRCFNDGTSRNFNQGGLYLDFDPQYALLDYPDGYLDRSISLTIGGNDPGQNNPCGDVAGSKITKVAGFNHIEFEINEANRIDDENHAICDSNGGLGYCAVTFSWYSDNDYNHLKPYYRMTSGGNSGGYEPIENLCINQVEVPVGDLVKDFVCFIQNTTNETQHIAFELRRRSYLSENSWHPVAITDDLEVRGCAGTCHSDEYQTPVPVTVDPEYIGISNMLSLPNHQPGASPKVGKGNVSGAAANYQLPLTLPPGRNSMVPQIFINYSSKAGEGVMGVGWSHSVGSSIHRCSQTWAQDGESIAVNGTESDRLCLNGQRLIRIGTGTTDELYWSVGAEYRTEIDSFSKVINSGNVITVYAKSGHVSTYSQRDGENRAWYLEREEDPHGNSIIYTYSNTKTDLGLGTNDYLGPNEWHLTAIHYTGQSTTPGARKVTFEYEPRATNHLLRYDYGEKSETSVQLESIKTFVGTQQVRSYDFVYNTEYSDTQLFLDQVEETATDVETQNQYNRVLFQTTWSGEPGVNQFSYRSLAMHEGPDPVAESMGERFRELLDQARISNDFNGDGIKEYIASAGEKRSLLFFDSEGVVRLVAELPTTNGPNYRSKILLMADMNLDGITDIVDSDGIYMWKSGKKLPDTFTKINQSQLGDYFHTSPLTFQIDSGLTGQPTDPPAYSSVSSDFYLFDYNGDGLQDIYVWAKRNFDSNDHINCLPYGDYGDPSQGNCNIVYNKLIRYKNTTEFGQCTTNDSGCVMSFAPGEVIVSNLEPYIDREEEADIWMYFWDDIVDVDDLNGDGLPDFHVRQLELNALFDRYDARYHIAKDEIWFSQPNSTAFIKRSLPSLGLSEFTCVNENDEEVSCDVPESEAISHYKAYHLEDINNDGLKDFIYHEMRGGYKKTWNVRLNRGGSVEGDALLFVDDFRSNASDPVNLQVLDQPGECVRGISEPYASSQLARKCNPYFRHATDVLDIDSDGKLELMVPDSDTTLTNKGRPQNMVFNYCSLFRLAGSSHITAASGLSNTESELKNSNAICHSSSSESFQMCTESVIIPRYRDETYDVYCTNDEEDDDHLCEKYSKLLYGPAALSSVYQPKLEQLELEIPLENYENIQEEIRDLVGEEIPQSPHDSGENTTIFVPACAFTGTEDPQIVGAYDMYEDYGPMAALSDRSLYHYNAINFSLNKDGTLGLSLDKDTGLVRALFADSAADLKGNGLTDSFNVAGCLFGTNTCKTLMNNELLPMLNTERIDDWNIDDEKFKKFGQAILGVNQSEMPGLLVKLEHPQNNKWYEWDYQPISDNRALYDIEERYENSGDGYINEADGVGSHIYFNSSMYVVSAFRESTGQVVTIPDCTSDCTLDSFALTEYSYDEAVYNTQGRGFQGFRTIYSTHYPQGLDLSVKSTSISKFHQVFPYAGKLENIVQTNDNTCSETTFEWEADGNYEDQDQEGVYFRPLVKKTESRYYHDTGTCPSGDNNEDLLESQVVSEYGYDKYGNTLSEVITTTSYGGDEFETTDKTVSTKVFFPAQVTNNSWWIDKLQSSTSISQIKESDGTYGLRTAQKAFFFWSDSKRTLDCTYTGDENMTRPNDCHEAVDSDEQMRVSFTYDDYGQVTFTSTQGVSKNLSNQNAPQVRTSRTKFDNQGYFIEKSEQGDLIQYFTYEASTGQVKTQTAPGGVVTENSYDAFGVLIKSETHLAADPNDLLAQPTEQTINSCFDIKGIYCDGDQTKFDAILTNINDDLQDNDLIENDHNSHFFTTEGVPNTPLLLIRTDAGQEGGQRTIQWLDQKGQAVLSRSRHLSGSGDDIYAGSSYVISMVNSMGQTELTTEVITSFDVNADPNYTFFQYDKEGKLESKVVKKTTTQWDTDNDIPSTTTCYQKTTYQYLGRGKTQVMAYGCDDSQPLKMYRVYDALGRLRYTIDADEEQVDYTYNAQGSPRTVVDAEGNTITINYDELGRKLSVDDPNMGLKSFAYNSFGETTFEQDANQAAKGVSGLGNYFIYDELGRNTHKLSNVYPSGASFRAQPETPTGENTIAYLDEFSYAMLTGVLENRARWRKSSTNSPTSDRLVHEVDYQYDDFHRPIEETTLIHGLDFGLGAVSSVETTSYYSDHNQVKQKIYSGSHGQSYSTVNHYDIFGNLAEQRENPTNSVLMKVARWSDKGEILKRDYYTASNSEISAEYLYYDNGQVASIRNQYAGDVQEFIYEYDDWGNISSQKQRDQGGNTVTSEVFTYDDLQRLSTSQVVNKEQFRYTYDKLGNILTKTDYTSSTNSIYGENGHGPNAITTLNLRSGFGTMKYDYDASGNRIRDFHNNSLKRSYQYDANKLLTHSHDLGSGNEISFAYDSSNQRYLKYETSQESTGGNEIEELTLYLGANMELLHSDVTDVTESKVHLTPYMTVTRNDNFLVKRHIKLHDRLGSTTLVVKQNGEKIKAMSYDPFGKPRNGDDWKPLSTPELNFRDSQLSSDITKRGFTEHEHLDNFELIHMNGRMYDFNNGRFLSVDPFIQGTDSQAINPYSYIQNNPLGGVDPTGYLMKCEHINCPDEDPLGHRFLTPIEQLMKKGSLNDNGGSLDTATDEEKDIADFNSEADKYLQQWMDRDPSQIINDEFSLSESHPWLFSKASHSAYFDPPPLFKWIGDPWAGWSDDRMNPITNEVLTPKEAFEARFFSIVDIGSLGMGKAVSTARYTDDFFASLANLQNKFDELADSFLIPKYKELDPMLDAGFTGSFRTGYVGNPNKPTYGSHIDFNNFDIDYYINSNGLHQKFGNSIKADEKFRKVLSDTPGFEGLRPNRKGFSIKFNPKE